jgi:hypothetical protein
MDGMASHAMAYDASVVRHSESEMDFDLRSPCNGALVRRFYAEQVLAQLKKDVQALTL